MGVLAFVPSEDASSLYFFLDFLQFVKYLEVMTIGGEPARGMRSSSEGWQNHFRVSRSLSR